MQIFQGAVGGVTGRGGESIRQIGQQSGCKTIKVPGKNEPKLKPRELVTITLTGTAEQNAVARQMIEMISDDWRNRPRGYRREGDNYDGIDAGGNSSIGEEGFGNPRTTFESGSGGGGGENTGGEVFGGAGGEWGSESTGVVVAVGKSSFLSSGFAQMPCSACLASIYCIAILLPIASCSFLKSATLLESSRRAQQQKDVVNSTTSTKSFTRISKLPTTSFNKLRYPHKYPSVRCFRSIFSEQQHGRYISPKFSAGCRLIPFFPKIYGIGGSIR